MFWEPDTKAQAATAKKASLLWLYQWALVSLVSVVFLSCFSRADRSLAGAGENTSPLAELRTFGTAGKEEFLYPDRETLLFQSVPGRGLPDAHVVWW